MAENQPQSRRESQTESQTESQEARRDSSNSLSEGGDQKNQKNDTKTVYQESMESVNQVHSEESAKREQSMVEMKKHWDKIKAGTEEMLGLAQENIKEGGSKVVHPTDEEEKSRAHSEAEKARETLSKNRKEKEEAAETEASQKASGIQN